MRQPGRSSGKNKTAPQDGQASTPTRHTAPVVTSTPQRTPTPELAGGSAWPARRSVPRNTGYASGKSWDTGPGRIGRQPSNARTVTRPADGATTSLLQPQDDAASSPPASSSPTSGSLRTWLNPAGCWHQSVSTRAPGTAHR